MTHTSVSFETGSPEEEDYGTMNPVGVVGITMLVTLMLALWLCTVLPLVSALVLAWFGGAVVSVGFMAVIVANDTGRP